MAGALAPVADGPAAAAAAARAPGPVHTLTVSGAGVASYPAYDPAVERYALTTTSATAGTVTVHATTTDAAGVVRVDGRVAPGGTATVSGLTDGDEVSVFIEDSAGLEEHALIYLPAGFPALDATGPAPGLAAGVVGLTLNPIISSSTRYVSTVDRNGVPTHVRAAPDAYDLKDQPDGSITYAEPTTTPGRTGAATVVLDDHWQVVRRVETTGLVNTDLHDSILEPDGTAWLVSYDPVPGTNQWQSVIQHIGVDGQELFRWGSQGLQDESALADPGPGGIWDYAHLNSIQVLPDGDVVASFRNLSAVLRIASVAHDGHAPGDIVWRLGGRASDFTFVDDPFDGPCAQHTATLLPNGQLLVFDDGSGFDANLCVDPDHPDGPFLARGQSRVAEYALDTSAHTATLTWSYEPPGFYTWFMGSARRLSNGNTLVGWAAETDALAQEVDAGGGLLWQVALAAPAPNPVLISYRASLMAARDADLPVVDRVSLADASSYAVGQRVVVDFGCTDRGGSSLRSCGGSLRPGGLLDTSTPGAHVVHLVASDGAGNSTTVTRSYSVTASYQPGWADRRLHLAVRTDKVKAHLLLTNTGTYADSFRLTARGGHRALRVRYLLGRVDVTRALLGEGLTTRQLAPGGSQRLRVVVRRTEPRRVGADGAKRVLRLLARSTADPTRTAAAVIVVRVRPG